MNLEVIKTIVSELNDLKATEIPENLFEFNFDSSGDLIIDWRDRKAEVLIKNLAMELNLDYRKDFWLGHTRASELPEHVNTLPKILDNFKQTLEDYIDIAELFIA